VGGDINDDGNCGVVVDLLWCGDALLWLQKVKTELGSVQIAKRHLQKALDQSVV
jgi:hypothetical protein